MATRVVALTLALLGPPAQDEKPEGPAPAPTPSGGNAPDLGFRPSAAPPVDATPGELGLTRRDDGGFVYVHPGKQFTAEFRPDGTVQFADRWRRTSDTRPQRGRCCALPAEGFTALNPLQGIGMSGPVEWLMALQGADPNAIAKNELLERTRGLRTALAIAHGRELLDRRFRDLGPELLAIWSDDRTDPVRRRELLFERWDECDERFSVEPHDVPAEAVSELDRVRVETAARARRTIEAFIRRHAPAATRRAYPAHELEALNRRRVSREEFSPYTRAQ
jgi:hypothetical protein